MYQYQHRHESITQPALDMLVPAFAAEDLWTSPSPSPQAPADASRYTGHYAGTLPSSALDVRFEEGRLIGQFAGDHPFVFLPEGAHQFRMEGGYLVGEPAHFDLDTEGQVSQIRFYGFSVQPQESTTALR